MKMLVSRLVYEPPHEGLITLRYNDRIGAERTGFTMLNKLELLAPLAECWKSWAGI